jgi:UTP--glucose-1-phosphate uridylyltransferase
MAEANAKGRWLYGRCDAAPKDKASSYGVIDIKKISSMVSVKGLLKTRRRSAVHLAIITIYSDPPRIMQNLNKIKSGSGGGV